MDALERLEAYVGLSRVDDAWGALCIGDGLKETRVTVGDLRAVAAEVRALRARRADERRCLEMAVAALESIASRPMGRRLGDARYIAPGLLNGAEVLAAAEAYKAGRDALEGGE